MPTVIALDTSLSMQRNIAGRSEDNPLTYHQLAVKGISQFLEHLSCYAKLEYIALVSYSYTAELRVEFTRDYDQVRQAVKKLEVGDKSSLANMMKVVGNILSTNWGTQNYCQLVVFTDCGIGMGNGSLSKLLRSYAGNEKGEEFAWIEALKLIKLNFVCLGVHSDLYFTEATGCFQKVFDLTGLKGQLFMTKAPPENSENVLDSIKNGTPGNNGGTTTTHINHKSELGRTAMIELIDRLCEANYKPYEATLKCGGYFRMECPILIWPPPLPRSYQTANGEFVSKTIAPKIEICGFFAHSEIGSPASLSRHLIIPKVEREKSTRRSGVDKSGNSSKTNNSASNSKPITLDVNNQNYEYEKLEQDIRDFFTKEAKDTDESGDDAETNLSKSSATTSIPPISEVQKESMCVLLHGALKVESLTAFVLLNENWYGFIYSFADSKKKSNLMLNVLPPGNFVIPWLGDLEMLGFSEDLMPGESSSFPVKADKRSYSQNCVVWIRHASLQSDIQKVLRHAKKMPEKTQHFYKELNRIRRAALSIGFVELLEAMATLFEKESSNMSVNAECSTQLNHAAIELRKPSNRDLKVSIAPLHRHGTVVEKTG